MLSHRYNANKIIPAILLAASALSLPDSALAQNRDPNAFSWSGAVAAGKRITVRNINGAIAVERSANNQLEVRAEKQWKRGDPSKVRIEQLRTSAGDIVVCAMWNTESRCTDNGVTTPRGKHSESNDVSVQFTLRVPTGVNVDVNTVNGEVSITGATAEVAANTVNGGINVRSSGGPVRAQTVNGSIDVAMNNLSNPVDLEYGTVNGSVNLELPSGIGARLDLTTVMGEVHTDFPITVSGTVSSRRLRGTIGDGNIRIRASTVNGGIAVRRAPAR